MGDGDAETGTFALSRIYGQGWTAAKKMLATDNSDVRPGDASAHNPYRGETERLRWEKGFVDALESPNQKIAVAGTKSWRRPNKTRSSE